MNVKTWLIPILIGVITFFAVMYFNQSKIGYVNLEKVFEEFEMKKELQKEFDNTVKDQQALIDSANIRLANLQAAWDQNRGNTQLSGSIAATYQMNERIVNAAQDKIEKLTFEFDTKIQTQLKQYLSDFGKSEGHSLLLGVMNDGTVLHGSEQADLTSKAIEYVNNRYLDK